MTGLIARIVGIVVIAFSNVGCDGANPVDTEIVAEVPPPPPPPPSSAVAWFEETWDYDDVPAMLAANSGWEDSSFGSTGQIVLLSGLTGTPGGFTRAMEAQFNANQGGEPQAGLTIAFRNASVDRPRELWIEFYARYSPNWTFGGPGSGSAGHKHLFMFDDEQTGRGRWEHIAGQFENNIQVTIAGTGLSAPFVEGYGTITDGGWDMYRYHARMDAQDGVWAVTVNGTTYDAGLTNTDRGPDRFFKFLALSRNLNQGTDEFQTLRFGPVRVYMEDPGW